MKRFFSKISFKEFQNYFGTNEELYKDFLLPKRKTQNSAGYDFFAIENYSIKPGETIVIPTGYKAHFPHDEMLLILVRSSMGFKYNIRLKNQVGLIDSDYYNNQDNEGHIFVALQNEGTEEYKINQNEAYAQGIFTNFLICDDDNSEGKRVGGIGSTNKKEGENNE